MLIASIHEAFTFWIYMAMAVCALIFVYKLVPETKGKSLEEIEKYWMHSEDELPSVNISKTKSTF
jgi:SP family arabinose:H+ symporter-like MFS transporter